MNSVAFIAKMRDRLELEDYEGILELLVDPDTDINQSGRAKITSLHCAIELNKPALVELFLMMNANPYCPSSYLTSREYAERLTGLGKAEILQLLPPATAFHLEEKLIFISAIRNADAAKIEQMLGNGFPYSDGTIFSAIDTGLSMAVKRGSFDIVEQLVRKGAMIRDEDLRVWLQDHRKISYFQPMVQLFDLEKGKQIQIMQAFCKAKGESAKEKLDTAREEIERIKVNFESNIKKIKNIASNEAPPGPGIAFFREAPSKEINSVWNSTCSIS